MKKFLFLILILTVTLTANAQVGSKAKAHNGKPQTTAKAQFTKGQYLVCTQDNVVLKSEPSSTAPAAKFDNDDDEPAAVSRPGSYDNRIEEYMYVDLSYSGGIKYLGKKQNGYLYVEVTSFGDIFDDVVFNAWIPEKYVKAACTKCEGHGVDYESFDDDNGSFKTCSKCRGRGY